MSAATIAWVLIVYLVGSDRPAFSISGIATQTDCEFLNMALRGRDLSISQEPHCFSYRLAVARQEGRGRQ